jgi:hypothetical protein
MGAALIGWGLWAALAMGPGLPADTFQDRAVFFERSGSVYRFDPATGSATLFQDRAQNPACSRPRDLLAFTRDGNVWFRTLSTGATTQVTDFQGDTGEALEDLQLPAGRDCVTFIRSANSGAGPGMRCIWVASPGRRPVQYVGNSWVSGSAGTMVSDIGAASWSPDGRRMAFSRGGDLWMAKIGDGLEDEMEDRVLPLAQLDGFNEGSPASTAVLGIGWSPDGRRLVLGLSRMGGSGSGRLYLVEPDGKRLKQIDALENEGAPFYLEPGIIVFSILGDLWRIRTDGTQRLPFLAGATNACAY